MLYSIDKGIIVDFQGSGHLPTKCAFLRNPYYALLTVLKSPHLILTEQLAIKDDASSIYPAFSPDRQMFEDLFKAISRLEYARLEIQDDRIEAGQCSKQMLINKYEILELDKALRECPERLYPTDSRRFL